MKKSIFKKIGGLFLGLAMGLGVAVGVTAGNKAASPVHAVDKVFYTLTPAKGSNNSYAGNCDIAIDGVTWNLTGNSTMLPWRIGGKNITNTARPLYSKTALNTTITKVEMELGAASSVTIVSSSFIAASDSDFTNVVDTVSLGTSIANKTTTIQPSTGKTWKNCYYKFVFNVTIGGSNKFIEFASAKFYHNESTPLTGITLSGSEVGGTSPNYTLANIAKSDTSTNHTVSVGLTPNTATDQKVKVEHYDGVSVVDVYSSPVTCTSGTGSFNVRAKGTAVGTERLKIYGNTETSVFRYLSVTVYDDSVINWTVSFDSDGGAPIADMNVEDGETFEFPSPGTKTHYSFDGWSSDGGNTLYDAGDESPAVGDDIEYTAYWTEDAKYNVTYIAGTHGSGSKDDLNQYAGNYTLLEFDDLTEISAASGYKFKDYTVNGVNKNPGDTISLSNTTTVTVNFEERPLETTYDFVTNFSTYCQQWDGYDPSQTSSQTSYKDRGIIPYDTALNGEYDATIKLYMASKQNQTITDRPVFATKTGEGSWTNIIDFTLNDSQYQIVGVTVTFVQWTTKTPDVALFSGTGSSGTPISTMTIGSSSLQLSADLDNVTSFSVGYCDKNTGSNVQAGLTSIYVQLASAKTLTSISVESDTHRSFDLDAEFVGETIYANYSSGDPVDVTSSATFSDYDMNALGDQTVAVSYSDSFGSANTSYTINIHYATVTSIELSTEEVSIGVGETFNLSNITVTISPSNADQNTYSWSVAEDDGALESSEYIFDATNKTLTAKEVDGYVKLQCTAGSQSDYLIVNITAGASASFLESEIEGIANVTSAKEMTVSVSNYTSITSYNWSVVTIDPEEGDVDVVGITNENSATTNVSFLHEGIATVSVNVELINKKGSTETVTASFNVYVTKQLASITAVLVDSDKTYAENTNVPASDIAVTKVYSDGQTDTATGFTVTEPLVSLTDKSVKVSYTEGEITKTADVTVTVVKAQLSSLSFTNKTLNNFKEGDATNGTFSLGNKAVITAKYATSFSDETVVSDGAIQSGIKGELRFELCSREGTSNYTYTKVTDIEIGDPMLRSYNGLYLRTFYKYDNEVVADAAQVTVAAPDVQVAVEEETEGGYSLITNINEIDENTVVAMTNIDCDAEFAGVTSSIGNYESITNGEIAGVALLTVSQGSDLGTYALSYGDGNYLCYTKAAGTTKNNNLMTQTEVDDKASWNISISSEGIATITNVYNSERKLQWNSDRFCCYSSNMKLVKLYKYSEGGTEDRYYTCTESLYDAIAASQALLDTECLAKNVQESTWSTISGYFSSFTSGNDNKILTKGKSLSKLSNGNIAEDFLARYDQIVHDYGYDNFLGRAKISPSRINPILALNEVDNSVWVISAVALVGLTAIGGYFFYRKRKEI